MDVLGQTPRLHVAVWEQFPSPVQAFFSVVQNGRQDEGRDVAELDRSDREIYAITSVKDAAYQVLLHLKVR